MNNSKQVLQEAQFHWIFFASVIHVTIVHAFESLKVCSQSVNNDVSLQSHKHPIEFIYYIW